MRFAYALFALREQRHPQHQGTMQRREFLAVLGSAATWPLAGGDCERRRLFLPSLKHRVLVRRRLEIPAVGTNALGRRLHGKCR